MVKVKKVFGFKEIAVKLAALAACFAVFAIWHTEAAEEIRSAPEALFAENYKALYEKASVSFADPIAVAVSGSSDERLGESVTELKLFGIMPARRIPTFVGERRELVPGGEEVGVGIHTEGVLVVGLGEEVSGGEASPAARAGLKAGDVILEVNGVRTDTAEELTRALEASQGSAELTILRGSRKKTLKVSFPDRGEANQLGIWVRDSTVGIGTLSFVDLNANRVAALGHSVSDGDTGSSIRVRNGRLRLAEILGVIKGSEGTPGELQGSFDSNSPEIGTIDRNTELGIFGELNASAAEYFAREALPVAFPDEVSTGYAEIICSCEGLPKRYSCRIVKVGRQSRPAQKGMVIEITDERLLQLTGGIVRGMSGSPIIQNGMLAGVVTHVFVNDPTRGYGAYAYWIEKACTPTK